MYALLLFTSEHGSSKVANTIEGIFGEKWDAIAALKRETKKAMKKRFPEWSKDELEDEWQKVMEWEISSNAKISSQSLSSVIFYGDGTDYYTIAKFNEEEKE